MHNANIMDSNQKEMFMKFFLAVLYIFLASSLLQGYSKKIVLGTFGEKSNADRQYEKLNLIIPQYRLLQELSEVNGFDIHVRPYGKYHIVVIEPIKNESVLNESLQIVQGGFKKPLVSDTEGADTASKPKKELPKQPAKVELPKPAKDVKKEFPKAILEPKKELPMPIVEMKKEEVAVEEIVAKESMPVPAEMPSVEMKDLEQKQLPQTNLKEEIKELSEQKTPSLSENGAIKSTEENCPPPTLGEVISEYFNWTYLIFIILLAVGAYYLLKLKKVYDQY